jgi:hypothetical protein
MLEIRCRNGPESVPYKPSAYRDKPKTQKQERTGSGVPEMGPLAGASSTR